MKSMLKAFYIFLVGTIIFTGALMIAEGLRAGPQSVPLPWSLHFPAFDYQEGRAL